MINRFSIHHAGEQPVRVLQHNITKQFEETNPTFLELSKSIIAKCGLQPGIPYFINNKSINEIVQGHNQTPFVGSDKKITIHETFLSYVWCVSYSMSVLYDEAVAKPSQNLVAQRLIHNIDEVKIQKAEDLFRYGISLITLFSPWDKKLLPNPEIYDDADAFWIENANAIFVFAMNFILCHEFAHVEKQHHEKLRSGQNTDSHRLDFEKEADERAIELMLLGVTPENERTIQVGILVGLCSLLFFSATAKRRTHPDSDDRIHTLLERINPEPSDSMWGIAALSYKLWDNQFSKNYNWPNSVLTMKELYENIREQIQTEKRATP